MSNEKHILIVFYCSSGAQHPASVSLSKPQSPEWHKHFGTSCCSSAHIIRIEMYATTHPGRNAVMPRCCSSGISSRTNFTSFNRHVKVVQRHLTFSLGDGGGTVGRLMAISIPQECLVLLRPTPPHHPNQNGSISTRARYKF